MNLVTFQSNFDLPANTFRVREIVTRATDNMPDKRRAYISPQLLSLRRSRQQGPSKTEDGIGFFIPHIEGVDESRKTHCAHPM